uniref:Uncharacterized protein n=1 Tax=Bradyrhizobium ottawaense TaxID=931866 RepID=A0A2U8P1E5_9BRAD|nr:hypothetical protein CIT37_03865 [Bradyrhizobium ottawaense]
MPRLYRVAQVVELQRRGVADELPLLVVVIWMHPKVRRLDVGKPPIIVAQLVVLRNRVHELRARWPFGIAVKLKSQQEEVGTRAPERHAQG